jgi:hypothetical protein
MTTGGITCTAKTSSWPEESSYCLAGSSSGPWAISFATHFLGICCFPGKFCGSHLEGRDYETMESHQELLTTYPRQLRSLGLRYHPQFIPLYRSGKAQLPDKFGGACPQEGKDILRQVYGKLYGHVNTPSLNSTLFNKIWKN